MLIPTVSTITIEEGTTMANKNATIGYGSLDVVDTTFPYHWVFTLRDAGGAFVGAPQSFSVAPSTVQFTNVPTGTGYVVEGTQEDKDGTQTGDVVKSAPFGATNVTTLKVVANITIQEVR